MRLQCARIQNYRLHKDIAIEFDPHLTLIAGDNETGKSTLAEAIHRALFLKATVGGKVRDEMTSHIHSGNPEVELRFTVGNDTYTLHKFFAGNKNGTTILNQHGGKSWEGESAEAKLKELLGAGVTPGLIGRAADSKLLSQWAHLWVWQGRGGQDPAQYVEDQQHELIQRLQRVGGAVAMQSALDGQVAEYFEKDYDDIFDKDGKIRKKKDSDLTAAETKFEQAKEVLENAKSRVSALEGAIKQFKSADEMIRQSKKSLKKTEEELKATKEKLEKLRKLRADEQIQNTKLKETLRQLEDAERIGEEIRKLSSAAQGLQHNLTPLEKKLESKKLHLSGLQERIDNAQKELEKAREKAINARKLRDFAVSYERTMDAESRYQALRKDIEKIEQNEQKLQDFRKALDRLPQISHEDLESLRGLQSEKDKVEASLKSAAPEIEVLAASSPVRIGDDTLKLSQRRVITKTEELEYGDLLLRIRPGSKESLASLHAQIVKLEGEIQKILSSWGVASIKEATEVFVKRSSLLQDVRRIEDILNTLNPALTRRQFKEAEEHLSKVNAEIERLRQTLGEEPPAPQELDSVRQYIEEVKQDVYLAESEEQKAQASFEALLEKRKSLEQERHQVEKEIQDQKHKLEEINARLRILVEQAGDEKQRERKRLELLKEKQELEEKIDQIRAEIKALNPDLLEADKERFERTIRNLQSQTLDAEKRRAGAQALLASKGSEDPYAELNEAEAKFIEAEKQFQAKKRHAEAIKLVRNLFKAKQQELTERFSQPLAKKISTYLQPVFGSQTTVIAEFEGDKFKGVKVERPGLPALSFESLSGGTKEQVATAVRLAIAELLAESHDGTLPIVFDDAFVNSDPNRIEGLLRTLDLGARRGLQIIVLTCHSAYYTNLGAKVVSLSPPESYILSRDMTG